jgi:hypothetical protein
MKKLFAGCVAVSFAAMLAACGDDSSSTSPDASGNESSSSVEDVSSSGKTPSSSEAASASSSSVASSESRALVSGRVWPQFLWDGSADEELRVVTGSDDRTAGYWYDFNDIDDGGSSKLTCPPDMEETCDGNWYTGDCYEFMMALYGGIFTMPVWWAAGARLVQMLGSFSVHMTAVELYLYVLLYLMILVVMIEEFASWSSGKKEARLQ